MEARCRRSDTPPSRGGKKLSTSSLRPRNSEPCLSWTSFPGRLMCGPSQIQPDEVTRGPWLVILTRMERPRTRPPIFSNGWGVGGRRGPLSSRTPAARRPQEIRFSIVLGELSSRTASRVAPAGRRRSGSPPVAARLPACAGAVRPRSRGRCRSPQARATTRGCTSWNARDPRYLTATRPEAQ